jgi:hypothetical protein
LLKHQKWNNTQIKKLLKMDVDVAGHNRKSTANREHCGTLLAVVHIANGADRI